MAKPDRHLRVGMVAKRLDVAVSTVWRWTKQKSLPQPIRHHGCTRWLESDIQEFIDQLKMNRGEDGKKTSSRRGGAVERREGDSYDDPTKTFKRKNRVQL